MSKSDSNEKSYDWHDPNLEGPCSIVAPPGRMGCVLAGLLWFVCWAGISYIAMSLPGHPHKNQIVAMFPLASISFIGLRILTRRIGALVWLRCRGRQIIGVVVGNTDDPNLVDDFVDSEHPSSASLYRAVFAYTVDGTLHHVLDCDAYHQPVALGTQANIYYDPLFPHLGRRDPGSSIVFLCLIWVVLAVLGIGALTGSIFAIQNFHLQ